MSKGIWYGIGAYSLWGLFPLYFKALQSVPALHIVAHRLIWSLLFLVIVVTVLREWRGMRDGFSWRVFFLYSAAAVLLALNWLVYIWGVNAGFVVETSLGYFINPLVNVMLGVVFFRERLSISKWIPIGMATLGVLYLTVSYGSLPWISLALAFTFGFYGLLKKTSPLGSLHGLTLETGILFVPSLAFLLISTQQGTVSFPNPSLTVTVLIMLSGVITALPLLMFSGAARSIPLSTLGLLQYIAPTGQFLLGVLLYHEPFTRERVIGFSIIWLALIILTVGGFIERQRALHALSV